MSGASTLLEVRGLVKHFPLKKDVLGRGGGVVRAVDGVDFTVRAGYVNPTGRPQDFHEAKAAR